MDADSPHHDPRSDQQLVAAINRGDTRAFEALYRRHRDWAVNVAHRFTHDRDAALDVMQEAFLYLLRQFPGFELRARFTTFFYPVLRHLAQQRQRKQRRETITADVPAQHIASHDDPPAEAQDTREALAALLDALPEAQREVVLLRFVDELSLEELAEATGVPIGTVKSRLHHALRRLRDDPRTKRYFEP